MLTQRRSTQVDAYGMDNFLKEQYLRLGPALRRREVEFTDNERKMKRVRTYYSGDLIVAQGIYRRADILAASAGRQQDLWVLEGGTVYYND